jgi:N-acyl homoserine lactone hydrolase
MISGIFVAPRPRVVKAVRSAWYFCLCSTFASLTAVTATANAPGTLRLYVLDCGKIIVTQPEILGLTAKDTGTLDNSNTCYLIRHGNTLLLFDAGLGGNLEAPGYRFEVPHPLLDQLAGLGVRPGQIQFVAVSHFHGDHVGNLSLFPNSTLLIQRREVEQMRRAPYPYTPPEAMARLAGPHIKQLDGDYDVFDDGSVVLESTPGHTPGHQSLLVRLPHTGTVLLSGDLYHYRAEHELGRVPPAEKESGTAASRARMDALLATEHGELWIGHDMGFFATLRLAPGWYE